MTISYPNVGSVLNERPPADIAYPSAPMTALSAVTSPPEPAAAPAMSLLDSTPNPDSAASGKSGAFEVVYDDSNGFPILAFADGHWFDVSALTPRPISIRHALRRDAAWAGAVVQTTCLWMRGHPQAERSFDLATELSLAVGELARQGG